MSGCVNDLAAHPVMRSALDASNVVACWDWDIRNDRVVTTNNVAQTVNLVSEPFAETASLSTALSCVHPEDRARVDAVIRRTKREGGPVYLEHRVLRADGTIRRVLASGRCFQDGNGDWTHARGITLDVTDRAELSQAPRDETALDFIAERCIAARRAAEDAGQPFLRFLIDIALNEVGRQIARCAPQMLGRARFH